jgi:hypothetical protein
VADAFLQLSPEEQADILQTRAAKLGRRAEHLEKDIWICWVLTDCLVCWVAFRWHLREALRFRRYTVPLDVSPRTWTLRSITNHSTRASTCKADTIVDATSCKSNKIKEVAERVGFEPTVGVNLHTLSKRAP